jgi:hypothetical protein
LYLTAFSGGSMQLPDELLIRANVVSNECIRVAGILSGQAEKVTRVEKSFLVFSNCLGAVSFVAVSFGPLSAHVPKYAQEFVAIVAALTLVLGPYIQSAMIKDPPSRFKDYSRYIAGYASKIGGLLADVRSKNRYEKLVEIIQLAEQNLTDAKTEWSNLLTQK